MGKMYHCYFIKIYDKMNLFEWINEKNLKYIWTFSSYDIKVPFFPVHLLPYQTLLIAELSYVVGACARGRVLAW